MTTHITGINTEIRTPDETKRTVLREKAQTLINEIIVLLDGDEIVFRIDMNMVEFPNNPQSQG